MKSRIVINGKWRSEHRVTGVQRYAGDLASALRELEPGVQIIEPSGSSKLRRLIWEQHDLPRACVPGDTLLCPANMGPIGLSDDVRLVYTLHCLRFLKFPGSYSKAFRSWYRYAVPRLLERADVVLTVSQSVADEIVQEFPDVSEKLIVAPPAASAVFTSADEGAPLLSGSEHPLWIYLGNATEAKNAKTVVEALKVSGRDHRLRVFGVGETERSKLGIDPGDDRFELMGHVNDPGLIARSLRAATGLVSPSRYESFGLPVLEAMACGCPVLASDIPAHREVGGDATVYISKDDSEGWALAMDRLARDRDERDSRSAMGISRAETFSWDKTARIVRDAMFAEGPVLAAAGAESPHPDDSDRSGFSDGSRSVVS